MVRVLASSAVDFGFEPQSGQTKTKKLVFVYSPQSMQHKGERLVDSESGYCVRVGRCVYPRTVVSVSSHYKNPTKRIYLVQSGSHYHLIEN